MVGKLDQTKCRQRIGKIVERTARVVKKKNLSGGRFAKQLKGRSVAGVTHENGKTEDVQEKWKIRREICEHENRGRRVAGG